MSLGAGSGPHLMDSDVCPRDAVTAASLAALLTCAELQALLGLHMPPCEVDLVLGYRLLCRWYRSGEYVKRCHCSYIVPQVHDCCR